MGSAPNVFLGFRITNPDILSAAEEVQQHIINNTGDLDDTVVPIDKAHVTILVFRAEEDQLEIAKKVIQDAFEKIKDDLAQNPLSLHFEGLGSFPGDKVVFAHPQVETQVLLRLNDIKLHFVDALSEHNFEIPGHQRMNEIKPHLTLMRIFKWCKMDSIPSYNYKDVLGKNFGDQNMESLQFLSMSKPIMEDGYYHIEEEYFLDIQ